MITPSGSGFHGNTLFRVQVCIPVINVSVYQWQPTTPFPAFTSPLTRPIKGQAFNTGATPHILAQLARVARDWWLLEESCPNLGGIWPALKREVVALRAPQICGGSQWEPQVEVNIA